MSPIEQALERRRAVRAKLERQFADRDRVYADGERAEQERAALLKVQADADVLALLDEGQVTGPSPEAERRLAELDAIIRAAANAGPEQARRIAARQAELDAAEEALAEAVTARTATLRAERAARVRETLAGVAGDLAELIAVDEAQTALIGRRFSIGAADPGSLWFAGPPIETLLKALPARFRPDTLTSDHLAALAAERRAAILQQVKG